MSFDFTYYKPNHADVKQVLIDLENEPYNISKAQLYSPINEVFLKLNNTNSQSTTLNYDLFIKNIINDKQCKNNQTHQKNDDKETKSKIIEAAFQKEKLLFDCINTKTGKEQKVDGFIKYSPLLDPIRYLVGKYDVCNNNLKELPSFDNEISFKKLRDFDNASYVDGFFSFLSSKLLHHHNFINALDCYGSFIGNKKIFTMDVVDDMDYLMDSQHFIQNNHILYEMNNEFHDQVLNRDSRSRKVAIKIHDNNDFNKMNIQSNTLTNTTDDNCSFEIDNIEILDNLDIAFETNQNDMIAKDTNVNMKTIDNLSLISTELNDLTMSNVEELTRTYTNHTDENDQQELNINNTPNSENGSTTCSSRTSHTSNSGSMECDEDEDNEDNEDDEDNEDEDGDNSTASEDKALINIYDFPINAILLERCENTLDYLCDCDEDFDSEQLGAALMQVIMTLIAYHKCFDFQHNDLHTNNIMFISTQKQFIYYKVNDTHYKVPTYGRIFKIIDFGRSTYKFRGNQLCSDSFHVDGDAHTQFNFGRHYNSNRPKLEPNNSFDLCRLGTSLIDFFIDDVDEINDIKDPIIDMVCDWCKDDKGRNILWKSNGDERYPGFKLYKMISRTVSKHTPISQLERPILERYKCARKNIKKGTNIMNIDALPNYASADACCNSNIMTV